MRRFGALPAAILCATCTTAAAADMEWLRLETARFTVLSQVDEDDTRQWATEFDVFISALGDILPLDESLLPPLTAVLFDRSRDFADYRPRTESGTATRVGGLFVNQPSWSVIGIPYRDRNADLQHTTFHEATHWFMSADPEPHPLWFDEGIAEVFATFEIDGDKAHWGQPIPGYLGWLQRRPLIEMEAFLRLSQDRALHGSDTYYPQSWGFVHYLMFGDADDGREALQTLLREEPTSGLRTAFDHAFGASFNDVQSDLKRYLSGGRYRTAEVDLPEAILGVQLRPATDDEVALALGRLAIGGNNPDKAREHVATLLNERPTAPETFDLLAATEGLAGRDDLALAALDHAIELGSSDALTFSARGQIALGSAEPAGPWPDDALSPANAREVADLLGRAIALRPHEQQDFPGFILALLCLDDVTREDLAVLRLMESSHPNLGFPLAADAAAAEKRGHTAAALAILDRASAEPMQLSSDEEGIVEALGEHWRIDRAEAMLEQFVRESRFDEGVAYFERALAGDHSRSERRALEEMRDFVAASERLAAVDDALLSGRRDDAIALLDEVIADESVPGFIRRQARRERANVVGEAEE